MTCESCRYYSPLLDEDDDVGACHRYPPQVVDEDGELVTGSPLVDSSGWCGEWAGNIN